MIWKSEDLNFDKSIRLYFLETYEDREHVLSKCAVNLVKTMIMYKIYLPVTMVYVLIVMFYLINNSFPKHNSYIERLEMWNNVSSASGEITISTAACGQDMYYMLMALLKSVVTLSKSHLHLIILTDVLKDDIEEEINKWPKIYRKRIKLEIVEPHFPDKEWKKMFRECSTARLFLPELLPNVDSLIYIDVDTVFLSPVEELWQYFSQMNSRQMLGLVRESYHKDYGWFHDGGRQVYELMPYIRPVPFNAGVLLMNLTRLRTNNWKTKITDYYIEYKEKLRGTADQGLINIFINKSIESFIEIPCHWNYIDEHCMFGPHLCESAQTFGIGLFHHHSNYKREDQSSHSVYLAFSQFSMTSDSIEDLIKYLERDIQMRSECYKLFKNFVIGIERFKLEIKF